MRTAVLADVHGNLPALEACLAAAARAGAERLVLGGDIVAGPFPAQTLDLLRAQDLPLLGVRGNGESDVLAAADGTRVAEAGDVWAERDQWVAAELDTGQLDYLRGLPGSLTEQLPGLGAVCFCHGTPDREDGILTPLTPEADAETALAGTTARVVLCGHIHVQYDRRLPSGRRVVNAGSVGLPYEGDPAAFWALLREDGGIELRRTDYDVPAARRRMRTCGFPGGASYAEEMIASPAGRDEAIAVFESRRS